MVPVCPPAFAVSATLLPHKYWPITSHSPRPLPPCPLCAFAQPSVPFASYPIIYQPPSTLFLQAPVTSRPHIFSCAATFLLFESLSDTYYRCCCFAQRMTLLIPSLHTLNSTFFAHHALLSLALRPLIRLGLVAFSRPLIAIFLSTACACRSDCLVLYSPLALRPVSPLPASPAYILVLPPATYLHQFLWRTAIFPLFPHHILTHAVHLLLRRVL